MKRDCDGQTTRKRKRRKQTGKNSWRSHTGTVAIERRSKQTLDGGREGMPCNIGHNILLRQLGTIVGRSHQQNVSKVVENGRLAEIKGLCQNEFVTN